MAASDSDPVIRSLSAVVTRSAASQVADQLVEAMADGRLKPNDRLPSERELAQAFGVSRPTVREAFAALELAGLVRSYQGRRTIFVGSPAQVRTWGVEILPPQVFEARMAIEPELAYLAAQKRYPDDLESLRARLDEVRQEFETTGAYASDLPVHLAVAQAARSPILERALGDALANMETPLWTDLRNRALTQRATRSSHVDELVQVVEHIEHGRARQAANVWRRHLLRYRKEMLDHFE